MTDSAFVSFTVKGTTPLAVDKPLAAEIVELPLPADSVTVLPPVSSSVTVMVEVVEPLATTDTGVATTVEVLALNVSTVILKLVLVAVLSPLLVAVGVTGGKVDDLMTSFLTR